MMRAMTVIPSLDARLLGQMVPGELIRFTVGGTMLLGMVAGCDPGTVVVMLEGHPENPETAGRFMQIGEPIVSETGLSYGTAHAVVVDPAAAVASRSDERFSVDGALLIGAGARAIRARGYGQGLSNVVLTIDTESWQAVRTPAPHPPPWRFAILAWQLRLLTDPLLDPLLPPVFTFRAGS
jgi:hypothetical protein